MSYTLDCRICDQDLTEDERDPETGSFYEAHSRCIHENEVGPWVVTTDHPSGSERFYAHGRRAMEVAERLASYNSVIYTFTVSVFDNGICVPYHTFHGQL